MTLSAHIATRIHRPRRGGAERSPRPSAHVVRVVFDRPDGTVWSAIGGGESVAVAIGDARAALPSGAWRIARYEEVYGV
jgi:hypothetical protein